MAHKAGLDKQAKLLLVMNTLYLLSIALSNTFVNVYLWKLKQDFRMIGLFNLWIAITMPIAFYIAGKLVKKVDRVLSIRLGVGVMAIFYTVVLLLGKQSSEYIIYLGILLGLGSGFYWLGYNVMYFEITNPENRDRFNGANGYLASFAGVAPLLSGWLLTKVEHGYKIIFSVSLGIFILAVVVSFFIIKRESKSDFSIRSVWRDTIQHSRWHYAMYAHIFQGIREGVFAFLLGLMVYISSASEFKLGWYTFVTSGVSLIAYFLIGKWMKPERRSRSLLIGTTMLSIVVIPLFIAIKFPTLLILGIGSALFYPFFSIPITSTTFDVIGENKEKAEHKVEYIIFREVALSIGRIVSILFFIGLVSFTQKPVYFSVLLFTVNGLLLFCWFFMKRVNITTA